MKKITIELILEKVCEYFNIEKYKLTSQSRKKSIMHARHVYYFLCRELTSEKLFTIALLVNRLHGCVSKSVNERKCNEEFLNDTHKVKQSIFMINFMNDDIDLLKLCVKR